MSTGYWKGLTCALGLALLAALGTWAATASQLSALQSELEHAERNSRMEAERAEQASRQAMSTLQATQIHLARRELEVGTPLAHAEPGRDHELVIPGDIKWVDGPASLAKGAKMVILEGDPARDGPFVLRLKLPDGFRVAPHTHPKDERVTVLAGTLYLGMGATVDEKAARPLPAGSYGRTKANMKHFGWVKGETILQLHGIGPWSIDYVDPTNDPRNHKQVGDFPPSAPLATSP